jgi:5'-methylthioadenosine phosphorylase
MSKSIAVILGSAFKKSIPETLDMHPVEIATDWGSQKLYKATMADKRDIYAITRHGIPHHLLPNQINYRAQAAALQEINCGGLLINSSVGVLDSDLPLYRPMLLTDLMMPENRLPDGTTCTMFKEPLEDQGHLVLNEGLFSQKLSSQVFELDPDTIYKPDRELIFVYAGGPRSKTSAENRMWAQLGGHVNSMTVAPEVVLANELEIPVAGMVVGHKYSVPGIDNPAEEDIRETLEEARSATENIILKFLSEGKPVEFGNHIYRY